MSGVFGDLPCWVEELTDDGHKLQKLAECRHPTIALGAYKAAVELSPTRRILCRDGARVLAEHKPTPQPVEKHRQLTGEERRHQPDTKKAGD